MSFDRLKAESVTLLATKIGLVSDSDVYNTIEMLLFLVREAELHKKMLHADYTNLKKVFERDEAIVRDILTEYNVPTTITESFFDTYIKSGGISDESIEETQAVLPSNTDDVDVSSPLASTITTQQQYPHAIGTPPINVAIPPPNAPAFRGVPNIPLPDLTQPPPVISNVGNI
uniref:Transcription initiation factor TFIID subunit 9 n=1 Tax=Angiostrongylus cantonensis TaxID=6313 RepID=A0A0K0DAU6_ANGCA